MTCCNFLRTTGHRSTWTFLIFFGTVQVLFLLLLLKIFIFSTPLDPNSSDLNIPHVQKLPNVRFISESKEENIQDKPIETYPRLASQDEIPDADRNSQESKYDADADEVSVDRLKRKEVPDYSDHNVSPQILRLAKTNFIINNVSICGNWRNIRIQQYKLLRPQDYQKHANFLSTEKPSSNNSILLILVHSPRKNLREREVIRNTYGSIKTYKNWDIRVVFLLGKGTENSPEDIVKPFLHIRLAWEIIAYGDVIMGNFKESFKTAIYKHIMGIRWAIKLCYDAKYVIKANDDNFVDIFEVIDSKIPTMIAKNGTFFCSKRLGVPGAVFGSEFAKITYCSGEAYLISMEGVRKLFSMVLKVPHSGGDDAYVTGLLRKEYVKRNPKEKMKIIHQEHIEYHEHDICEFTGKPNNRTVRLAFHKLVERQALVNDAWCLWKTALEFKGLLQSQVKKFILSSVVI